MNQQFYHQPTFAHSSALSATASDSSSKSLIAVSVAAVALLGATTVAYSVVQSRKEKRKAEQIFKSRTAGRRSQKLSSNGDDSDIAPFLRKQPRRATLYFDENDELVDEETAKRDPYNYYHKYHAVQVDFGGEDYSEGATHKITKDIFWGEKNTDNAQIFIDQMHKAKQMHQKKMMDQELFNLSVSSDSEDSNTFNGSKLEMKDGAGESVIMDINPNKFDKAKDHLFFDFFSLYAKNFIDDKNPTQTQLKFKKMMEERNGQNSQAAN